MSARKVVSVLLITCEGKMMTITNEEYNKLCLDPFITNEFSSYDFPRYNKIPGLSQTDPVPLTLVTPAMKSEECRAYAADSAREALKYYYMDDWEEYFPYAVRAARYSRYAQLHHLIASKTNDSPRPSRIGKPHPQSKSRLLALPLEIRNMIWCDIFEDIEYAYIEEQLRGSSTKKLKELKMGFQPIRTCRQVYREVRQIGTLFHFSECPQRLETLRQIYAGPYRIAIWLNPYTPFLINQEFKVLFKLEIRTLTICSNWLVFQLADYDIKSWIWMLMQLARKVEKLKNISVITGCPVEAPQRPGWRIRKERIAGDGGFAQQLRSGWNSLVNNELKDHSKFSVDRFTTGATRTSLGVRNGLGQVDKVVTVNIDSVYWKKGL